MFLKVIETNRKINILLSQKLSGDIMFGHKNGKVERRLDGMAIAMGVRVNELEKELRVKHKLGPAEVGSLIEHIKEWKENLEKLKSLSGRIHDIIEKEL